MVIQSARRAQAKAFSRIMAAAVLLPVLVPGILVTTGCAGPSYYAQAAAGQIGLVRQREEVTQLLADPDTDPELARNLRLAQDMLSFGSQSLGLPSNGSYTRVVETGRAAVTWNVVAAPEFSLEPRIWCFLVAGCVPYRGYFDPEDARRFADRLQDKGYDVIVAPATAYSTLGWFDDPLLDTMFLNGDAHLAGVLFHEMAHQALYVKGDTRFNESFASFVEQTAVRQWLTVRGTEEQQAAWERSREVDRQLTALIGRSRSELARLYATERPAATLRGDKARVFEQLCADYRNVLHPETDNGKPDAAGCRLNNASIALRGSYHDGRCAFERLFLESGSHIPGFLDQARRIARLPRKERSAWMKQACSPVAPGEKL